MYGGVAFDFGTSNKRMVLQWSDLYCGLAPRTYFSPTKPRIDVLTYTEVTQHISGLPVAHSPVQLS